MEEGSSHLRACQVFTIIEVVVIATLIVIQSDQVPFHRVLKVFLLHEHVRAEDYLVFFGYERPLHESVTVLVPDVQGRLKHEVARYQAVRYRLVKLV